MNKIFITIFEVESTNEKILNEKVMNSAYLDGVSGGSCFETSQDGEILNVLLRGNFKQCDRYNAFNSPFNNHSDLVYAWDVAGIHCTPFDFGYNW